MSEKFWKKQKFHTKAKLTVLKHYLLGWYPIVTKYQNAIFIDGFAGKGKHDTGEKGSPLIEFDVFLNHGFKWSNNALFLYLIEKDYENYKVLKQIYEHEIEPQLKQKNKQGELIVELINDTFENGLNQIMANYKGEHLLVFIDPFGYTQFTMEHIKQIMKNKRGEVIITLIYDHIDRFKKQPWIKDKLDALFGTYKWEELSRIKDPKQRKQQFISLFKNQLKNEANADHVFSIDMRDKHNKTVFFMVYATHSLKGVEVMKRAMSKIVKLGEFTFYSTDPSYAKMKPLTFFLNEEPEHIPILRKQILEKFKGKTFLVKTLEEFILGETDYLPSKVRELILKPWEKEGKLKVLTSNRKRSFSYPEGTRMKLLE